MRTNSNRRGYTVIELMTAFFALMAIGLGILLFVMLIHFVGKGW